MKNFETFYEPQTAIYLKEIIQPPIRSKLPTFLQQKFSNGDLQEYTDICFPSAPRMQFLCVQKWCSAIFFSDTNQKHVFGSVVGVYFL